MQAQLFPYRRWQRDIPTIPSRYPQSGYPVWSRARDRYRWLNCGIMLLFPLTIIVGALFGLFWAARQNERLNVLILGVDRRPGETGPFRTDTIILSAFDPNLPQAALLSIPRDLWVDIPGHNSNRINTANYFGDLAQEGYGPILAMQTVAGNFGIPVHGYVRLDFNGFVALVDALGGIEIDVPQTIVDEAYPTSDYGYTTIVIQAGRQRMDGETALIYARTRHAGTDFDRSQRQQQILRALLATAARPAAWLRLPAAWAVARATFETNLSEIDLATILLASLRAGPEGLETAAVGPDMALPYITDQGAQVLLPQWEVIRPLVTALFLPQ